MWHDQGHTINDLTTTEQKTRLKYKLNQWGDEVQVKKFYKQGRADRTNPGRVEELMKRYNSGVEGGQTREELR